MKVRKAVIPAAGLGTRFLPATKSQPKEMLPIVDKPAIQYVVENAVRAGIEDILIITGRGKRTIEDHFDRSFELEVRLEASGKFDELKEVRAISDMCAMHYIRQREPLGLGAAVGLAEIHLYGAINPESVEENLARVIDIVEKPPSEEAPSNLAAIGCYVFTPEIFDSIRATTPDAKGEVQLTDAINHLAQQQAVYAYIFEGVRYDVGNKLDYLRATVELALDREDLGGPFRSFLADLVQRRKLL